MRSWLLIYLAITLPSLPGEENVRRAEDGRVLELTLKMQVLKIETTATGGLRLTAKAERETAELGLVIDIPGGSVKKGDRTPQGDATYKFPVMLRPTPNGLEKFDKYISSYFGHGARLTIFKPRGYAGSARHSLYSLRRKGGMLYLTDPGVDGDFYWSMAIQLEVERKVLSLVIGELRF